MESTIQPTINKVLDEVTQKRISIKSRISRYAKDGEYVSLAEQVQGEMFNQQALNHLRFLI